VKAAQGAELARVKPAWEAGLASVSEQEAQLACVNAGSRTGPAWSAGSGLALPGQQEAGLALC